MIAVYLVAIFLFVGWIFLLFPLSEYKAIGLLLGLMGGLVAVVIVAATMIMSKLNSIHKLLQESKNNDKKSPENTEKQDEKID